jgi:Rad3-related DNA helicase
MNKQLNRLKNTQKNLFTDAINVDTHKISLFEAPTGFGKSVIANTIAEYLACEKKKKIIIVTTTNHLAIEQLKLFKNDSFDFEKNLAIDLVVGKDNYFSPNNITNEVYEYIDKNQLDTYISNISDNDGYLIESLFDNVDIEEPNKNIVQNLICLKDNNNEHLSTFEDLDIAITNYAFFFTNVFYVKDFDISKYIVIGDEIHQLVESVESLLTNSFSLYRYKNLINQLITKLPQNKSVKNYLTKLESATNSLLIKYSNSAYAGSFYSLNEKGYGLIDDIRKNLLITESFDDIQDEAKKKNKKSMDAKIKDMVMESKNDNLKIYHRMYQKEKSEMFGILSAPQDATVFLSPSKGYPTLNAAKGDIRGWLLSFFWDKVESFIGLSATIKANQEDDQAFNRLGIYRSTFQNWLDKVESIEKFLNTYKRFPTKDDKEYLKLADFLETQKKGFVEGFLTNEKEQVLTEKFGISFFSGLIKGTLKEEENRVTHIKYGVKDFTPLFKPEQARAYLPSKELLKPIIQGDDDTSWINMIVDVVKNNHDNKNSMVICGSFYEVEKISELLEKVLPNINIISAKRNTPATQIIEEFKNKGGIAVVTRNYGTGVNLPKELLQKLFIIKLPFPVFTTKKWVDVKILDKKFKTGFYQTLYQNEMFTVFRQWIGRLIRTTEDKGDLYILDSRYWEAKNQKTLEYWVSKMAIIQNEYIEYEYIEENKILNKEDEHIIRLITDFENALYSDEIKQYLLVNINYIKKYKKIPLLTTNTMEFNKQVYKIKSLLEKQLAEV